MPKGRIFLESTIYLSLDEGVATYSSAERVVSDAGEFTNYIYADLSNIYAETVGWTTAL
jgi:hypothetical protein